MRIGDAASMLRKKVAPNTPPFEREVAERNNERVDEWYETVLKPIANSTGEVRAGKVWEEWTFFLAGKEVPEFLGALREGLVPRIGDEVLEAWRRIFATKTAGELSEMGMGLIQAGWNLVSTELLARSAEAKWKNVFSTGSGPLVWRKKAAGFPALWAGEDAAWPSEERNLAWEKINAVARNQASP